MNKVRVESEWLGVALRIELGEWGDATATDLAEQINSAAISVLLSAGFALESATEAMRAAAQ